MDPNPSSFLPLYFVSHNSTNCIPVTYITIYILANYHPLLTASRTIASRTIPSRTTPSRTIASIVLHKLIERNIY